MKIDVGNHYQKNHRFTMYSLMPRKYYRKGGALT